MRSRAKAPSVAGMNAPVSSDTRSDRPARLSCPAVRASLPTLLDLLDEFCEREGVDAASRHDLRLIVEEACVNVIDYAYPPGSPGSLTLQIESSCGTRGRLIEVTIEDNGKPFNPLTLPVPDQSGPLDDLPVGGLGVHLVRQLSNTERYRHDPERGNVLTLGKYLRPATND